MTTTAIDPRPLLGSALDQVERLILGTTPGEAGLPTPCGELTVGDLIGHLQAVVRRIGVVLDGRPFDAVPSWMESEDWAGDWHAGRTATEAVISEDAALGREVTVPWGRVPGAAALGSYVGELTVHAWDLARATGRDERLDGALAETALAAYREMLPPEPRGGVIPFGPVVEVGPDAGAYDRLVAWTGRDPGWTAEGGRADRI